MEPAATIELLTNLKGNSKWISENYGKLKNHYNNQWVAVLNRSVADHDTDFNKLVKRVKNQFPQEYNEVAFEFVTSEESNLIL